jgi:hypothetical protein
MSPASLRETEVKGKNNIAILETTHKTHKTPVAVDDLDKNYAKQGEHQSDAGL